MSTATVSQARPGAGTRLPMLDPAVAVARSRPRTSVAETVGQTLSMAWRALKKMRRNPEQFFDVTLQPLLIPGIVAQTVLTTCMSTGVQLREDMDKGVFDRFKSLPIARLAPLAGP